MSVASVQTSVAIHPDLGFPGQEYDSATTDKITRIAGATIPYGAYVIFGGETCALPASASQITGASGHQGGVALRDPTNPSGQYVPGDPVAIMRHGRVWVPVEEAVTATDKVFVRFTGASGASEAVGYFRNDSDGATSDASAANPPGVAWFKGGSTVAVLEIGVAGAVGGATTPTS